MSDAGDLLEFLCREPRPAGSARAAAVADHLRHLYSALGYRTDVHEFTFTGWEQLAPPRVRYLHPVARELDDCLPVVWSPPTPGPVTGRVRPVSGFPSTVCTFEEYEWAALPVVDDAGAVVARLLTGPEVWPQPLDDATGTVPTVMVGAEEYRQLRAWLRRGVEPAVEVSAACRFVEGQTGRNLVASAGDRPSVLVTAHYDSFFTTTGAHDNASGTAALAGLARRLAPAPRADVAFVAFDAEEWNKLGAYRYVDHLAARGELERLRAVVNVDSVGVGDAVYMLVSPGLGAPIRRALRQASAAGRRYADRSIDVHEVPAFRVFDTWPFMRRGVPVVQIGTAGDEPFRHWHRPGDRLDLIGPAGRELIADVAELVGDLLTFWLPPAP